MPAAQLFGRDAAAWASNAAHTAAIFAGPDGAVEALIEIVRQRMAAQAPVAALDVPEPELARAAVLVEQGLATVTGEARLNFLDLLGAGALTVNGRPQHELAVLPAQLLTALRDVALMADFVLVRSQTQAARLRRVLGCALPRMLVEPARDARVPPGAGRSADQGIAVWAPDTPPGISTLIALALGGLQLPVTVIGGAPELAHESGVACVPLSGAAAVLAGALAVVDASPYDPGSALALAELGIPLATAMTSGAHEYLVESSPFVPWNRASVRAAAIAALGHGAPCRTVYFPSVLPRSAGAASGELASVIVPTFNRRAELAEALESIARQTYPRVEAVVVNDAGEPVDDVVARYPCARLVTNATNLGLAASRNAGIEASRGRYVAFLDDDDLLFPDHVAHLVAALERTGAAFVYANVLSRFFTADAAGARLRGYWVESPRSVSRADLLIANAIPVIGAMIRRETLLALGGFDAGMRICLEDYDLWLRVAANHPLVHVDRVTSIYNKRDDRTNMIHRSRALHAGEIQRVWARHPVAAGSSIEVNRRALLEQLERAGGPPVSVPPIALDLPLETYAAAPPRAIIAT
jgi:GT2 family glycosyltransferase